MRKKSVLLGFIEAVNFVNEKNSTGLEIPVGFGALDDRFDIFLAGGNGGDFYKISIKLASEDAGEGGFASAGWTPKN